MNDRRPYGGFPEPNDPFVRVYGGLHHHREPVDARFIQWVLAVLTVRVGRALGIIAGTVLLVLTLLAWFPVDEPRYHGKTLSAWMRILSRQADEQYPNPEPVEAIRAMGTNAVPHLSRMLTAKDSPRNIKVNEWLRSHEYWDRLAWRTADEWRSDARGVLPYLDLASVQLLAPSLMRLRHDPDPAFQWFAWRCLSLVHLPPVLHERLFREALTNEEDGVRGMAMVELTPPNTPGVSVPILLQCLKDPAWNVRGGALNRLEPYQTNAAEAVAFLIPYLEDPNLYVQREAIQRLSRLGTNARPALPALVAALQNRPPASQYGIGSVIFDLDRPLARLVLTNAGSLHYSNFVRLEEFRAGYKAALAGR